VVRVMRKWRYRESSGTVELNMKDAIEGREAHGSVCECELC